MAESSQSCHLSYQEANCTWQPLCLRDDRHLGERVSISLDVPRWRILAPMIIGTRNKRTDVVDKHSVQQRFGAELDLVTTCAAGEPELLLH